jgi:hypothetical protein
MLLSLGGHGRPCATACAVLWLWGIAPAAHAAVDHTMWDELTERFVAQGRVDYAGVARNRQALDRYLVMLAGADPAQLSSDAERLAFWINAYNACVVKSVLDHQPLKSVKDVKGFFNRIRFRVAGQDFTLDEIEAEGRKLNDWRVHFAVVCASASCPPIRSEAYTTEWLDAQLTEQVREFLRDGRNGLRLEGSTLWVSSIFKWYAKDFVPGRLTAAALLQLLRPYLDPAMLQAMGDQALTLKFLPYDWSLNAQAKPAGGA